MPLRYTPPKTLVCSDADRINTPLTTYQMQFPKIIALIDARIALLEQVRDLLAASRAAEFQLPPRTPTRPHPPAPRSPKRGEAKTSLPPAPAASATPPEPPQLPELPEPVQLPLVAPRPRPAAKKKPAPPEAHSALAGHLPAGPVVVSAARVLAEEAQRHNTERKPLPAQEQKPAEPNQILRRWLQEQQISPEETALTDHSRES